MKPFSSRHITESGLERLQLIILPQFSSWLGLLHDSEPWLDHWSSWDLFFSECTKRSNNWEIGLSFPATDFFFLQPFHWMFPQKHNLIALKYELVLLLLRSLTHSKTLWSVFLYSALIIQTLCFPLHNHYPHSVSGWTHSFPWHLKAKKKVFFFLFPFQLKNKSLTILQYSNFFLSYLTVSINIPGPSEDISTFKKTKTKKPYEPFLRAIFSICERIINMLWK